MLQCSLLRIAAPQAELRRLPLLWACYGKDIQIYNQIILIQDITQKKSFEDALIESERSKTVLLSHLPGLAYRCKYDTDWTMLYVSHGCFDLTGYPSDDLLYNRKLSFNDIISPEYRKLLNDEWINILKRAGITNYKIKWCWAFRWLIIIPNEIK